MLKICSPNIPAKRIRCAVIDYRYFEIIAPKLTIMGIECIKSEANGILPININGHPDMQFCAVSREAVVMDPRFHELSGRLNSIGFRIINSREMLEGKYPGDCLFNAAVFGRKAVLNKRVCAAEIISELNRQNITIIDVNQGYGKCSIAIVSENALITADERIADRCCALGVDVLRIAPGNIEIEGYDYGFIGGCCGLVSPTEMVFTGSLDKHPDGDKMRAFLKMQGVKALSLTGSNLFDIGGIIPILE